MHQITVRLCSRIMMTKMQVIVLLPEKRDYTRKMPVVWLLHGATETPEDFLYRCDLQQLLRDSEAMVVMPEGMNSDFADQPQFGTGYRFAEFFFQELMPFITNSLSGSKVREENFITGYSMGGAGALMLGLAHPEKFAVIAPLGAGVREYEFLLPDLELSGEDFRKKANANRKAYPTEYGDPAFGITPKEINMIAKFPMVADYVGSMECTGKRFAEADFDALPSLWFCCGEEDGCCSKVTGFVTRARAMGFERIQQKILPGLDHSDEKACVWECFRHLFPELMDKQNKGNILN
ncbi:MAG: esterase family protein [Clostridiales bacterium]|nr:esterase family protein [Clostridiales bacterium]